MTLSMHGGDVRRVGDAVTTNLRNTLTTMLKGALVAVGLAAAVVAIVVVRIYVYLPGMH